MTGNGEIFVPFKVEEDEEKGKNILVKETEKTVRLPPMSSVISPKIASPTADLFEGL